MVTQTANNNVNIIMTISFQVVSFFCANLEIGAKKQQIAKRNNPPFMKVKMNPQFEISAIKNAFIIVSFSKFGVFLHMTMK